MANTILLMSDEHNPMVSSVYGHPTVRTPHMERMAEQGTMYRHAYCPSPLCFPSRSAFMSGKRVHELQAYSNCSLHVKKGTLSYGKALADQGIHSVHIGKVDVYDQGENLGFSEMIRPKDRKSAGDIHIQRRPLAIRKGGAAKANGYGVKEDAFDDDLEKIDEALLWLAVSAPKLERPWMLTVNIVNPHSPQWNTQEFWDKYPEGDLPKYGIEQASAKHPYAQDLRDHFKADLFTENQVRGLRRGYYGNVSFVDQQLGRLIDYLEHSGLAATTNLLYVSDHGEMLGKFGMWWKSSLFEDSARIPCLALGPDYRAGTVVETPVDLFDVQASLFWSAGATRPADWAGTPLQEIPENDSERIVFSEYHGHGTRSGAYMVRKRDWKLIYNMEAPHQLFHLAVDPDELCNVFTQYPGKALELEAELRKICSPEQENKAAHQFQQQQITSLKLPSGKGEATNEHHIDND
jgi:choline-sulfatase